MSESHGTTPSSTRRRERWVVGSLLVVLVLVRSAVFVLWEEAQFDADQGVMGLMAKHIAEGRAFPVFFYGSNHILAVQAWLAAPLFAIWGTSVTALKLPLVALQVVMVLLLLRTFERDAGLRPAIALVPILLFALPAPVTAAHLIEPSGGNGETLLYVLLLWIARHRPVLCGVVFAIGFLHREFTIYGLTALIAIQALRGSVFTWEGSRRWLRLLLPAAAVWAIVQVLRSFSSSVAGPGTTLADMPVAHSNITELANRICLDPQTVPAGLWKLATAHWPTLFGVAPQRLVDFGIDSELSQGAGFGAFVLAATMLLSAGGVVHRLVSERRWRAEYDVCAYLTLAGLFSALGYVVASCGTVALLRYELLSLLGGVGLVAWFFCAQRSRAPRAVLAALVVACALIAAVPGGRLLGEYAAHPKIRAKRLIARHLEAQGVQYGTSDYWLAYSLTFLTDERVILASEDFVRIATYERIVNANRGEAIRVSRRPCSPGRLVAGVWFCPPE
jgi:hypothetical protein